MQILHQNYRCPDYSNEDHAFILKFTEGNPAELNLKINEEINKNKCSPCCLLKRFFQLPTQFSEKGYKISNSIVFEK